MSSKEPLMNNGERIYYKNLALGIIRQSKIEETKKNDEDNFTMEFKFHPHIEKNENDKYSNVQSKLFRESKPIKKYKDENETFQPNKNTKVLEPKTEEDIKKMTERLYSEQLKFKENKEKLYQSKLKEECPFTPTINVQGKADSKYFMMRLEKWNKKMEEKAKKNNEEQKNLNVDKTTGQKLFQPKVDDPVAKKLKRDNENVYFDLYNKGLEHIGYRKKIMETDTRVDLKKIENEKKEKIKNLKEERDRYKKEKKEKFEKEIYERSLKAKAEKENMEKLLKERIERDNKEHDSNKKKQGIKDTKDTKDKKLKEKNIKEIKDNKGKKINKSEKKEIIQKGNKSTSSQKNKNNKIPLNNTKKFNTEAGILKSIKDTKIDNNVMKKLPVKKNENNRAKSQSQKPKKEIDNNENKFKTIETSSKSKNKKLLKPKNNNLSKGKDLKLKGVKNVKNDIVEEKKIKNVNQKKKGINKK